LSPISNKVIIAGWLGWFSVFAVRFAPSPILVLIENSFKASHSDASIVFTSHLLAYALMQIPAGIISDTLGPRRVIIVGLMVMSLSCIAMGLSPNIFFMIAIAFIAGLGAGTFYTSSTSLISTIFPPSERGRALGIMYSGIGAGSSTSMIVGGLLGNLGLWREIFYIAAAPGIIAASMFAILMRGSANRELYSGHRSERLSLMFQVLRRRDIAIYSLIHALLLLTYFGVSSFMPTYIVSIGSSSILYANLVSLALSIPDIFGGFVGGHLIGILGARRMVFIGFLSIALATFLIPSANSPIYIILLLPIIGFMSRSVATALPLLIIESTPIGVVGAILGWYNSIGFIGGSTGPYLFGVIADRMGFTFSYIIVSIFPAISSILIYLARYRS
jgi:predicted MFS family arabinose efflux permease